MFHFYDFLHDIEQKFIKLWKKVEVWAQKFLKNRNRTFAVIFMLDKASLLISLLPMAYL